MLYIERCKAKMDTFVRKKDKERALVCIHFVFMKMRLSRAHRYLNRLKIAFSEHHQGYKLSKSLGVHNVQMRVWLLSTYIMSKLKHHEESLTICEWRTNFAHDRYARSHETNPQEVLLNLES